MTRSHKSMTAVLGVRTWFPYMLASDEARLTLSNVSIRELPAQASEQSVFHKLGTIRRLFKSRGCHGRRNFLIVKTNATGVPSRAACAKTR